MAPPIIAMQSTLTMNITARVRAASDKQQIYPRAQSAGAPKGQVRVTYCFCICQVNKELVVSDQFGWFRSLNGTQG